MGIERELETVDEQCKIIAKVIIDQPKKLGEVTMAEKIKELEAKIDELVDYTTTLKEAVVILSKRGI
jgi:hypothetical protein